MPLSIAVLALLAGTSGTSMQHFRQVPKTLAPKAIIQSKKDLCFYGTSKECWEQFMSVGQLWAGDINGDGIDELVIYAGDMCGTLGCVFYAYEKHNGRWRPIQVASSEDETDVGWRSLRPRFDILPIVRGGHHDLRIGVADCLKWDGKKYVEYADDDYHQLSPDWFDGTDSYEAEIFWAIQYAGRSDFAFEPRWFSISPEEFLRPPRALFLFGAPAGGIPRIPLARLDDPGEHITWIGLSRGGVWGVQENRAFLLVPQLSYLGAAELKLQGDWLRVSEDMECPSPEAEYARSTHRLRIHYSDRPEDCEPVSTHW